MKNIHVIATDKPSRVAIQLDCKPKYNIQLAKKENDWTKNWEKQNIYITSDEEIKEGDWLFSTKTNNIFKADNIEYSKSHNVIEDFNKSFYINSKYAKKIILTTDTDLIKNGVQPIDDEFLEWFVNNSNCESVEVERMFNVVQFTSREFIYKIIIPKEESKQDLKKEMFELEQELDIPSYLRWHNSKPKQETLEKREPYWDLVDAKAEQNNTIDLDTYAKGIQDGANWQQERMYSEEEVIELLEKRDKYLGNWLPPKKWLEQFKKEIR